MKTTLRDNNIDQFQKFLKRFNLVESTLLLEICSNEIKAKTHTPDRAVVKYSSMDLADIFTHVDGEIDAPLLFGIFNIEKLSNAFKHFSSDADVDLELTYVDVDGKNVGTKITLRSERLTIDFDCANYRLFTHISDEMFDTIAEVNGDLKCEFNMVNETFGKISSLSNLDRDQKIMRLRVNASKLYATGKSFNYAILETSAADCEITFYKQYFNLVDREATAVKIAAEKIVFLSDETKTITVIGKSAE